MHTAVAQTKPELLFLAKSCGGFAVAAYKYYCGSVKQRLKRTFNPNTAYLRARLLQLEAQHQRGVAAWEAVKQHCVDQQTQIVVRNEEVTLRESTTLEREQVVRRREENLVTREASVVPREQKLTQQEVASKPFIPEFHGSDDAYVCAQISRLKQQYEQSENQRTQLTAREKAVGKNELSTEKREQNVKEHEQLPTRKKAIEKAEESIKLRWKALTQVENDLTTREKLLQKQDDDVTKRERELLQDKSELGLHKQNFNKVTVVVVCCFIELSAPSIMSSRVPTISLLALPVLLSLVSTTTPSILPIDDDEYGRYCIKVRVAVQPPKHMGKATS